MRIIGIDPGLRVTGWGLIAVDGNRLRHLANGTVTSAPEGALAARLCEIHDGLRQVFAAHAPDEAAIEETFVNRNPSSTLKLGQARGVALLVPAQARVAVHEYAANLVKKSVVGVGHADKAQVRAMVGHLLPGVAVGADDAGDALAVAICHAHHCASPVRVAALAAGAVP